MSITSDARARAGEAAGGRKCPGCGGPIAELLTREGLAMHPTCEPLGTSPDEVVSEIFTLVTKSITTRPRDLQTKIGPSEIGHPCDRRIGYKILGIPPVNERGVAWKPFIGTALHEQMAQIMTDAEIDHETAGNTQRWHVEERVTTGLIVNGEDIDGSCDLYDAWTGGVLDFKFTTKNKIREEYGPHGPGSQYQVQAHDYGQGWINKGFPVRWVGIIFLTRDGEFTDRHFWQESFNPGLVQAAHERVERIDRSRVIGANLLLPSLATAESYCNFCPWRDAKATDLAKACPGHPTDPKTARPHAFTSLIASN